MLRPLALVALALVASSARAEEAPKPAADAPKAAVKPARRQNLVEITPFLSFVGRDLPGPIGGAVGEELAVGPNWNVGAQLGVSRLRRLNSDVRLVQDASAPDALVAAKLDAYSLLVHGRFYAVPLASSWFMGFGAGTSTTKATFAAGDARVSETVTGAFATAEGGYRWLFGNGLAFRTSGLAHSDAVTAQRVGGGDEALRAKLRKGRGELAAGAVPAFSFGLGLAF